MKNIALFALTATVYFSLMLYFVPLSLVWLAALAIAISLPINIGGSVFTIAGNAKAEKNIYSIFSVYQEAEQKAFSIVNVGYQRALNNNAASVVMLGWQMAHCDATAIFGCGFQDSGEISVTIAGSVLQKAHDSTLFVGFAMQYARNDSITVFGLAIQNSAYCACLGVGIALYQIACEVELYLGIAVYQNAIVRAAAGIGFAIYQRVSRKGFCAKRAFGAFSSLINLDPEEKISD